MTRKKYLFLIPFFILSLNAYSNGCEEIKSEVDIQRSREPLGSLDNNGKLIVAKNEILTTETLKTGEILQHVRSENSDGHLTLRTTNSGEKTLTRTVKTPPEGQLLRRNQIREVVFERVGNNPCVPIEITYTHVDTFSGEPTKHVIYDRELCESLEDYEFAGVSIGSCSNTLKYVENRIKIRKDQLEKEKKALGSPEIKTVDFQALSQIKSYCDKFPPPKKATSSPSSPNTGNATKN